MWVYNQSSVTAISIALGILVSLPASAEIHSQHGGPSLLLMTPEELSQSTPDNTAKPEKPAPGKHRHDTFATQADIFSHGAESGNIRTGDNTIEIYGSVFMSLAMSNDGHTTLTSTGSRIGFRGHKSLDEEGLLGFWQIESIVDLDNVGDHEHGGNRSRLAGRDSFVGISDGFGTLVAGKHNTPYKMAVHSWDPFNHIAGDFRSMLGRVPGFTSELDHHGNLFHLRTPNSLIYYPPSFNGITLSFAIGAIDESGRRYSHIPVLSGSINYNRGGLNLTYACEGHSRHDIYLHANEIDPTITETYYVDRSEAHLVGAMYHFGSTMISAVVERIQISDELAPSGYKWSWHAGAIHKLATSYSIRAGFGQSMNYEQSDGGSMLALGLFNTLSEDTDLYFSYVQTMNNPNGYYGTFFSDAIEDAPEPQHHSGTDALAEINPYTLSAGIIHQF